MAQCVISAAQCCPLMLLNGTGGYHNFMVEGGAGHNSLVVWERNKEPVNLVDD